MAANTGTFGIGFRVRVKVCGLRVKDARIWNQLGVSPFKRSQIPIRGSVSFRG